MKQKIQSAKFAVSCLLAVQLCVAVFAQSLGSGNGTSTAGQTGAGRGSEQTAAAKSGGADGAGNPQLGGERRPLYRLCRSDVVNVSFTLSPEFDQTLTVQPDGYVELKDAGMVEAQGLTLEEFREEVQRAYKGYLHDPEIAVALKDFEHPYFIAGGEVGRPGKYELRGETTVLEALQIAGGFTQQAKHSQVLLFRRVNDNLVEARILNLKKMLQEKNLAEDPRLHPGDLIYVPQNAISKIARYLSRPSLSMYVSSAQF
ncbi:MAG TPA: polysaccharide biosynthesis/export family protein [Candidatus Aquilonibacter sp.]|nr:polysaccharide biosynthesis/export family protein [Candidatus Aquilonibacter sp.]